MSDLKYKGDEGGDREEGTNPSVKRGEKLIPTISRNSWKYRCPPGWRSARILALFAHFVSPRSLPLPLTPARSLVPALFLSHPLTGASQFYRHVPCLPLSYLVPSYPLSSIHRFTNRRLTGGGDGGSRCLASGHHPRSPQFPTPPDGEKGGTTRPISSLGERQLLRLTTSLGFSRFASFYRCTSLGPVRRAF